MKAPDYSTPEWHEPGSMLRSGLSWRKALRAERKSPRTVDGYLDNLRLFDRWLRTSGRPVDLASIRRDDVRDWLASLTDRTGNPARPSTVQTRYKGLRVFFAWAVREGDLDDAANPMRNVDVPKLDEPEIPVLSDEQLAAIVKACEGTSFDDRRDLAIVRMFLDTGVRLSELTNLTADDVDDVDHDVIHVMGKGSKGRAVPFGPRTSVALDRYRKVRDTHPFATSDRLWLGARGPLTDAGVRMILRRRGAAAGVPGLHAHQFRHTFAHRWLAEGGQEGDLMRLTGWKARQMVDRYGRSAASERAHDAHRKLGLGDRV